MLAQDGQDCLDGREWTEHVLGEMLAERAGVCVRIGFENDGVRGCAGCTARPTALRFLSIEFRGLRQGRALEPTERVDNTDQPDVLARPRIGLPSRGERIPARQQRVEILPELINPMLSIEKEGSYIAATAGRSECSPALECLRGRDDGEDDVTLGGGGEMEGDGATEGRISSEYYNGLGALGPSRSR